LDLWFHAIGWSKNFAWKVR